MNPSSACAPSTDNYRDRMKYRMDANRQHVLEWIQTQTLPMNIFPPRPHSDQHSGNLKSTSNLGRSTFGPTNSTEFGKQSIFYCNKRTPVSESSTFHKLNGWIKMKYHSDQLGMSSPLRRWVHMLTRLTTRSYQQINTNWLKKERWKIACNSVCTVFRRFPKRITIVQFSLPIS